MNSIESFATTDVFFYGVNFKRISKSDFEKKVSSAILSNFDPIIFNIAKDVKDELCLIADRLLIEARSSSKKGAFEIKLHSFEKFEVQVKNISIPMVFPKIDRDIRINMTSIDFPSFIKDRVRSDNLVKDHLKFDLALTFKELNGYFSKMYPRESQTAMSFFLEGLFQHNPFVFECLGKRGFDDYKNFQRQVSRIIGKVGGHF